jgi:hypothetical protein
MATRTTLLISIAILELCLISFLGLVNADFSSSNTGNGNINTDGTINANAICTDNAAVYGFDQAVNPTAYNAFIKECQQNIINGNPKDFQTKGNFFVTFVNNIKELPFLGAILILLTVAFFYILTISSIPTINAGA